MITKSYNAQDTQWIDIQWAVDAYDWKYEDLIRCAQAGNIRILHRPDGETFVALPDVLATLGMPSYNKRN